MTPRERATAALDALDAGDLDAAYAIVRGLPRRRPTAIRLDPGWRDRAACRDTLGGLDPEIFGTGTKTKKGTIPKPVTQFIDDYCAGCPVVAECFHAGAGERYGVWGGVWKG